MKKSSYQRLSIVLVTILLATLFLTGCTSPAPASAQPNSGAASSAPAASAASAASTAPEAPAQADTDPFGKYEPGITIDVVRSTDTTVTYAEGESVDSNAWVDAYRDILGISFNNTWIVDSSQYAQKLNMTIASGDLPDLFAVSGQQLNTLLETDDIEDLSVVFEQYIAPQAMGIIQQDERLFELGKRDGKLYGIPNTGGGSAYDSGPILFVREDWRTKLGLPEPKTTVDFLAIAEAFATQDPDGNGVADTYALALTKTLHWGDAGTGTQGVAGMQGFANAYHAYPGTWILDSSGQMAYGSIQPEMKTTLEVLRDMYAKGWIDKEFAVKDMGKVAESLSSGKTGMEFGQMWNPFYPLVSTLQNDSHADWQSYPIPSSDAQPAKAVTRVSAQNYWVVRKGFEHPEAIIKMLNLFTEKCWGETADNAKYFNGPGGGVRSPFKFALVQAWPAMKNINAHKGVNQALDSGDTSHLDAEGKDYYDRIKAYEASGVPADGWGDGKIFGKNATYDVIGKYVNESLYLYDEYHDIPTPTMVEKLSTLNKMELEIFTKIIMGASMDEFDTFVDNWKKLGGDDITKELNALPR